jgi:hypothetical protein
MSEGLFDGYFDPGITLDLMVHYQNAPPEEEVEIILRELTNQIGSLINIIFRMEVSGSVSAEEFDGRSAMTDTLEHVYELLVKSRDKFPTDNERLLTRYLWVTIKRELIWSIGRYYSQEFEFWKVCSEPPSSKMTSYKNAEDNLYMFQLRRAIYRLFKADVRFNGKEKDACLFMASCMLGFRNFDPSSARLRYTLQRNKAAFLLQYTRYLLQSSYYAVRQIDEVSPGS